MNKFGELVTHYTNKYTESTDEEERAALGVVISTLWERNHIGYARLEISRKRDKRPGIMRVYSEFIERTAEEKA